MTNKQSYFNILKFAILVVAAAALAGFYIYRITKAPTQPLKKEIIWDSVMSSSLRELHPDIINGIDIDPNEIVGVKEDGTKYLNPIIMGRLSRYTERIYENKSMEEKSHWTLTHNQKLKPVTALSKDQIEVLKLRSELDAMILNIDSKSEKLKNLDIKGSNLALKKLKNSIFQAIKICDQSIESSEKSLAMISQMSNRMPKLRETYSQFLQKISQNS